MRILLMGPWPISKPTHGGQIRASNILANYKDRGHAVKFIGLYDKQYAKNFSSDDIAVDQDIASYVIAAGVSSQISLWDALANVPSVFERILKVVQDFKPDIVEFEEPYFWPVVKRLRDEGHLSGTLLVHSSYNFETSYRKELANLGDGAHEAFLLHVARQEREIAEDCDLVVAVSDSDAENFRKIGAKRVVIARNGSRSIAPSAEARNAVNIYLGGQNYALFVSSDHLPNVLGLLEFLKAAPPSLPGEFVICGSIAKSLTDACTKYPLLRRARILGLVDPSLLDALLLSASAILLPKLYGGGSNLKTSEALISGRPIVATRRAFDGFEPWIDSENVTICNDKALFWRHTEAWMLKAEVASVSSRGLDIGWNACLQPMIAAVESFLADPSNPTPIQQVPNRYSRVPE